MPETDEDMQYRVAEQSFVERLVGDLHRRTEEDYVQIFGYLACGLVSILAGNRHFDPLAMRSAEYLPKDEKLAEEVKKLWNHLMHEVTMFCIIDPQKVDQVQMKYILLRIYEKVFNSVSVPVIAARSQQNTWRT